MDQFLTPSSERADPDNGVYDYCHPYGTSDLSPISKLISALASTAAFKRLNDIRFLGAIDYCIVPSPNGTPSNSRYTRAQHSLGVAALANEYLSIEPHSLHDSLLCVAAALLHDIGHAPFSHTLEPILRDLFFIDHHSATESIILGRELGSAIRDILIEFGLNPLEVIAVLSGDHDPFSGFFSGPINFDTIEGILRSRSYLKMQNLGVTPLRVVAAAVNNSSSKDKEVTDNFWNLKDEMYNLVIRSRSGVFFDALFQAAGKLNATNLTDRDFFSTETALFKRIPLFRDLTKRDRWNDLAHELLPSSISYQVRRFVIDEAFGFSGAGTLRYRQTKRTAALTLKDFLPI